MARGHDGAFGGKRLNSLPVWLGFCAVFVLGLADLRRLRSVRNLDLLVLVSLSVSLWFFNEGRIFTSVPLVYPVLLYLLARTLWIGLRGRPPAASRPVWPVWLLIAATIFLAGFRIGLDVGDSNVIDVGYSGVIGAHRIANGQAPYGHFPLEEGRGVRARRSLGARRAAHPGERALRGAERARRHLRAGDVSGVPARLRDLRLAGEGGPLARRALHGDRLRSRLPPRARARRAAVRRPAPGGDARVRLGGLPLHPVRRELELERRDPAGAPDLRLLASVVALGARKLRRPCLVDEVRAARRRAAVGDVPRAPCPAHGLLRGGLRGGDARGVLGAVARARPAGRRANRVGPHDRPPVRPRVALLALGLAPVPRRPARPSPRATGAAVAADRRCDRSRLRPSTEVAASAGGAHGGAADRLRDRPHALVLPLRRVVLPVRRLCDPRPSKNRGRLYGRPRFRWESDASERVTSSSRSAPRT